MSYALVTGASSGLGIEFAKLFAQQGIPLVISSSKRSAEKLQTFAKELNSQYGIEVKVCAANLDETDAVAKLVSWMDAQNVEIEYLVNNAGFGITGYKLQDYDAKKFRDMLQVNIMALSELVSVYTPRMVAKGKGKILNISSIAAYIVPHGLEAAYSASKSYVMVLSECMADDLRGTGVTCTHLAPGPTRTEFFNTAGLQNDKHVRPLYMEADEVAKAGFDAMMKGEVSVIPGLTNRVIRYAARLSPSRRLTAAVSGGALKG
jgi:short-subunit dehydrogenase